MELKLEQEYIDLIKKSIINNKKYANNEDLYDDFFNETCKRALVIIKTIKNKAALEAYLKKIATTSIIQVLKDSGRVRRVSGSYVKQVEEPLETVVTECLSSNGNKYSNVKINYDIIDISDGPEEVAIKNDVMQRLYDAITVANSTTPAKQFLTLYNLRYVKNLKQKEIAAEMNISQSEVSKRLLELMEQVKVTLNNG